MTPAPALPPLAALQVAGTYLLSRAAAGDYSKAKPAAAPEARERLRRNEVLGEVVVPGRELAGEGLHHRGGHHLAKAQ